MTEQPDNYIDEMQEIVDFLCGEKPLQGRWYGEKHPGIPTFWWRNNLRIAVRQLDQYYADFYRNKMLEAELNTLKHISPTAYYYDGTGDYELVSDREKRLQAQLTAQFNSRGDSDG